MYDVIIIGGGAGGYGAAIYCSRFKLKTLVIAELKGGTSLESTGVENYAGFKHITGAELMKKFEDHVLHLGVEIRQKRVQEIKKTDDGYEVDGEKCKYVILATGTKRKKLDLEGIEKFEGRGVAYCAICDAAFFKDKITSVVGGGDSAVYAGLILAAHAKEVHMFVRSDKFRAEPINFEKLSKLPNVKIHYNAQIQEIKGEQVVESVVLNNGTMKMDGVFIEVGSVPNSDIVTPFGVQLDEEGYIKVNKMQETSVDTIYAVGDVTDSPMKQIITAAAEGSVAALSIHKKMG